MSHAPVLYVEDDACFARAVLWSLDLGAIVEHVDTLARARDALRRAPRAMLIVDIGLPDGTGFDLLEQPIPPGGGGSPHVLICTALGSPDLCARAVLAGAQYLEKIPEGASAKVFVEALRRVVMRVLARSRGTEERKLEVVAEAARQRSLTLAERRVLELIALGASRDEIAAETGTAIRTVKSHIERILDKLEPITRERSIHKLESWVIDRALYDAVRERI